MIRMRCVLSAIVSSCLVCLTASAVEPTRRGDVNQDGLVDLGDIVVVLKSLYGSESAPCAAAADANIDGKVDLTDAIHLSQQVFLQSDESALDSENDNDVDLCLSSDAESQWEKEQGGGGSSLLWSDELNVQPPVGPGKYLYSAPSGAITLRNMAGETGLMIRCRAGQPRDSNGRVRSEISLWEPGRKAKIFKKDPIGSERWYAYSIYLPTDWWQDENKIHLVQWHGTEDAGETGIGRNPPLTLIALRSELRIRQLWSARRIQSANENRTDLWKGKLERGKWLRFVFHMKWSYKSDGFLEVWKDGKKIVDQRNHPNCYNDAEGPYFNLGLYWPAAIVKYAYSSTAQHTAYYDLFKVGDQRNVLKDLSP